MQGIMKNHLRARGNRIKHVFHGMCASEFNTFSLFYVCFIFLFYALGIQERLAMCVNVGQKHTRRSNKVSASYISSILIKNLQILVTLISLCIYRDLRQLNIKHFHLTVKKYGLLVNKVLRYQAHLLDARVLFYLPLTSSYARKMSISIVIAKKKNQKAY